MLRSVVVLSRSFCLLAALCLALHPAMPALAQEPPPQGAPPAQAPANPPEKDEPATATSPETPAEEEAEAPTAPVVAGATLKGKLVSSDRKTPLPGAKVHAVAKNGTVYSSEPADAKGHYRLAGVPPGGYRLALSTEDGVYMLESEVGISSANVYTVDLAAIPAEAARGTVPGLDLEARGFAAILQGTAKGGAPSFWKSAKGITLLAVSAGALALILTQGDGDDEQPSVSPSLP